ncbi:MAG TPA: septum formation family protein [Marmoricola sp.]
MTGRGLAAALLAPVVTVVVVAVGCTTGAPQAEHTRSAAATASPRPSPSPSVAPSPPPAPAAGSCHRLSFAAATSPTDSRAPVPCRERHTSVTAAVGHFDPVQDGHLVTVDSRSVQQQIADRCPRTLAGLVGGSRADRRLSRFIVVWFSPTEAQAAAGARWYRCDVVALAAHHRLATLPAHLKGALDRRNGLDRYGTCGTSAPDARNFRRVICSQRHRWRAVSVVNLPRGAHFHSRSAGSFANSRCKQVAADAAHGALKYSWAFEWPTREHWVSGQRYGFCWLPTRRTG